MESSHTMIQRHRTQNPLTKSVMHPMYIFRKLWFALKCFIVVQQQPPRWFLHSSSLMYFLITINLKYNHLLYYLLEQFKIRAILSRRYIRDAVPQFHLCRTISTINVSSRSSTFIRMMSWHIVHHHGRFLCAGVHPMGSDKLIITCSWCFVLFFVFAPPPDLK